MSNYNIGRKITITTNGINEKQIEIDFGDLNYQKPLGNGQFGSVGKYLFERENMKFALKRIIGSRREKSEESQEYELRDLEVLTKIGDSPFTVKYYGAFYAEGEYWIVTECMDTSLHKFYAKANELNVPITEAFISRIAYSILKAIEFLKLNDIIHRDIKPSNVLINYDGAIKLCDFGISGFLRNSCAITFTGCQIYMSPEKINLNQVVGYSVKSDIWSLGISLIEIALGSHPFSVISRDTFELILFILNDPSPKLPVGKYSVEFNLFVDLCLIKDPKSRGGFELLNHEFINKYLNEQLDSDFIKLVIDNIENN